MTALFEGVGIATTTDAANKAFIMNRVGDFAMLTAMFLLFQKIGTLDFNAILEQKSLLDETHLFWITLLIFIGCTGKSAQIPLYTWLPDAMAGPTPVSALIHAATMVTSGVYLIARLAPLYVMSPATMQLVATIGALTAILAATIALAQYDIKKVLAYSTVSQLGYMFLALGVGAFSAAIFHLITHAFFKACLFLGSGSVIHALHEEQDIRKMGGLRSAMPATSLTFLLGSLALAGAPLTAGFFSKDEILAQTFASGQFLLYGVGLVTAAFTAFYTMRLYALTFLGAPRYSASYHPHESPFTMTLPLWLLGVLSLLGGLLNLPPVITAHGFLHQWLQFPSSPHSLSHSTEWVLLALSSFIALVGLFAAYSLYSKSPVETDSAWRSLLSKKYYIDELYERLFVQPFQLLLVRTSQAVEQTVLENVFSGLGKLVLSLGEALRSIQSGIAQNYALAITLGLMIILSFILVSLS
ncbi:MAG: NADH-quinone oxidoreductase subunit L [Chloroherpetonaceae bacterium]|nr:NADH-quinone oxidoreductase subunit L [Chloroherpetonaceae bacterium]